MFRICRLAIASALIWAVFAVPCRAEGHFSFGGGVATSSFAGDLRRGYLVEIKPGPGPVLCGGWRISSLLTIEARLGRTLHHEELSKSDVTYTWTEVGPLLTFRNESNLRPIVFAGAGSYDMDTTGAEFSGNGIYAGAGLEEVAGIGRNHLFRIAAQGTQWTGDPYDLDVKVFNLVFLYRHLF